MWALTLDMPPLPPSGAQVIAYHDYQNKAPISPDAEQFAAFRYKAGAALTTAPQSVGLRKESLPGYQPRTELGKRLLALRQAYVASGGRLLSAEELDAELRARRGGAGDD